MNRTVMVKQEALIDSIDIIKQEINEALRDTPEGATTTIGIRPKPVIPKPESCSIIKSEPLDTKSRAWAPGAWQDATRTSAFQPYKPPTLLTNLQRGNTQTEQPQLCNSSDLTFHVLAGQGELTPETNIPSGSIDTQDEYGLTALMWAAAYGQLGSARYLLKNGANKNFQGKSSEQPLHYAAAYGHQDMVKLLLNHGADANSTDNEGNTPLIYGARGDHPHVCFELLTRGADPTHRNNYSVSAYHATILSNSSTAKTVIENYLAQQLFQIQRYYPN